MFKRKFEKPSLSYWRDDVTKATIESLLDYTTTSGSCINRDQVVKFSKFLHERRAEIKGILEDDE